MIEILTAIFIHLVVPLIGLGLFIKLRNRMTKEEINNPPTIELFIIFATYGGLLLVTLTSLFWTWSGLASLGTFYLILGAPLIMGIIAYRNYKLRRDSKYRDWTFKSGILYFIITPITLAVLFFILDRLERGH
jgi:membrane protein insertase Oxa1/YidC/SpoIIIJ